MTNYTIEPLVEDREHGSTIKTVRPRNRGKSSDEPTPHVSTRTFAKPCTNPAIGKETIRLGGDWRRRDGHGKWLYGACLEVNKRRGGTPKRLKQRQGIEGGGGGSAGRWEKEKRWRNLSRKDKRRKHTQQNKKKKRGRRKNEKKKSMRRCRLGMEPHSGRKLQNRGGGRHDRKTGRQAWQRCCGGLCQIRGLAGQGSTLWEGLIRNNLAYWDYGQLWCVASGLGQEVGETGAEYRRRHDNHDGCLFGGDSKGQGMDHPSIPWAQLDRGSG